MATFNTAFGSLPGTNDALGINNNAVTTPPANGQPKRRQRQQTGTPTFAQLQASGQARPAPPSPVPPIGAAAMAQPAPPNATTQRMQAALAQPAAPAVAAPMQAPAPTTPASAGPRALTDTSGAGLRAGLLAQINAMLSGQEDPSFAAQAAVKRADLEEDFRSDQRSLQEQLAARGLFASTIGANQMGSLSSGQARALASLEADTMRARQEALTQQRTAGTAALTTLAQMTSDIEMRAQQLQQQAALEGRALDLTQARDQASRDLGFGQLQLGRDQLAQQGQLESARMEETRALRLQNLGISGRELDLRAQEIQQQARFQNRTLDLQEARDLAEVDFRTQQLMREDRSLNLQEARDRATQEIERDRLRLTERGQDIDNRNAGLDRDLRALLGNRQIDVDVQRLSNDQKALFIQLANVVGIDNLTPEMLQALGLPARTGGTTPPPPIGTGGTTSSGAPGMPGGTFIP